MQENIKIKIDEYIDNNLVSLSGRDNGVFLKEKLKKNGFIFPNLEKDYKTITLVFPDRIIALNESFFLGLLENQVQNLCSKEKFFEKYIFIINQKVKNDIESKFVYSALRTKSVLNP